jgi:hypothetical protein
MALVGIGATVARAVRAAASSDWWPWASRLLFFGRGVSLGKRLLTIVVVGAGLSVWAPQGYWRQMKSILSPKEDYNYTSKDGRKEIAKRGVGYMLGRPIFGLGIGNFEKAECSISEKARNTPAGWGIRCTPPPQLVRAGRCRTGGAGPAALGIDSLYGIISLLRLGRRLPYRWRRGTREERFLRLACAYFAVALVGFTATCFFLNFAWLEPYYVLAAFVAALMGVIARRVKEQRMETARGGAGRQHPAPGSRRHHGRASAGTSRPGAVSAPAGHAAHCTASARRPQFVVSGTIIITDADERAALSATRFTGQGRLACRHVRHRKDIPRRPLPLFRKIVTVPDALREPGRVLHTPGGASRRPRMRNTSSRSARQPCLRSCRPRDRFRPNAIPWPGLQAVRAICDKRRVLEAAPAFGIGVPRQVVLDAVSGLRSLPEMNWPVVVKPARSVNRPTACPRSSACAT